METKIMNEKDLHLARNKYILTSLIAMKRAAIMARELAVQTNTAIIVVRDGKIVRITADELRKEGFGRGRSVFTPRISSKRLSQ
jgi:imidazolonepropionase-like amidohydrolase